MAIRHALLTFLAGCALAEGPPPEAPDPLDTVWREQVHGGDLIVAVPGTGGYDTLGKFVDAAVDPAHPALAPTLDGRVDINPIAIEQAIAAAQRAGFSDAEIEARAVTIAAWGIGVTKATAFTYESLGGLRVRIDILGGTSKCAVGGINANLTNYTQDNALTDARDLYTKSGAWLAAHPPLAGTKRHVSFAGHSWGGAVVEYAAKNFAQLHDELGELPLAFTVAAGVPQMILGYTFQGPGLKVIESQHGATELDTTLVEIDRPDDPVHQLQFSHDMEGHQYDIMFGDAFQGSYGITTLELSCHSTPGPCP